MATKKVSRSQSPTSGGDRPPSCRYKLGLIAALVCFVMMCSVAYTGVLLSGVRQKSLLHEGDTAPSSFPASPLLRAGSRIGGGRGGASRFTASDVRVPKVGVMASADDFVGSVALEHAAYDGARVESASAERSGGMDSMAVSAASSMTVGEAGVGVARSTRATGSLPMASAPLPMASAPARSRSAKITRPLHARAESSIATSSALAVHYPVSSGSLDGMAEAFAASDRLEPAVEAILRAESWETLTREMIIKKLEQKEGLQDGSLQPQKSKIKEAVDTMMKKVLAPPPLPQQGRQMTAGMWDDNANPSVYMQYVTDSQGVHGVKHLGFGRDHLSSRCVVTVIDNAGLPVRGVQVQAKDTQAISGSDGRAVLYIANPKIRSVPPRIPDFLPVVVDPHDQPPVHARVPAGGAITVKLPPKTGEQAAQHLQLPAADPWVEKKESEEAEKKIELDLVIILDSTASMGDEMAYLSKELESITRAVTQVHGEKAAVRVGAVLYRDVGDQYLVKPFDLTHDVEAVANFLGAAKAGGGGDFPEAPEVAFEHTARMSWRALSPRIVRMAFWVTDAPHHDHNAVRMTKAVRLMARMGVRVYPVMASETNTALLEYTMRMTAAVTSGKYIFLTDDSGIGGSHGEPHIPCYHVVTLSNAMRRAIATELSGEYIHPEPSEVIRRTGNTCEQRQYCTTRDGTQLLVY